MKPLTYALISLVAASICNGELLPTLPFPLPLCTSTTTISLGGTYTVTSTSTVTSVRDAIGPFTLDIDVILTWMLGHNHNHHNSSYQRAQLDPLFAPKPVISLSHTRTTIYTPTSVTCLSTGTTFAAYPSLLGLGAGTGTRTLAVRAANPEITLPPILPTGCPTVTVIPPTVSNAPCTRLEGGFTVTTNTITKTKSGNATVTTTPISTQVVTETWIQPTPTSYNGLNYYQYVNGYNYNTDTTGLGGGGYSTSHWNGNLSYYTSGLTRNIDFESPNWPTGPALCQLPGQATRTDCSQWTVVFQGFLFARIAGNYTVHAPTASESPIWQDNSGFWWGGEKAYTGYMDENVDGGAALLSIDPKTNYFEYVLEAGEFLPFTQIYNNGWGPAANQIDITGPDGVRYPDNLDLFVPPCDESAFVP
ncbi:hypothetical protein BDW67DRAFT_183569 [Aspergillus spinulosporus]